MQMNFQMTTGSVRANYVLQGHVKSHVGCVRTNNEDNYILLGQLNKDAANEAEADTYSSHPMGEWSCIGIFDGMGGGEKGEVAANIAATELKKSMEQMQEYQYAGSRDVDSKVREAFLSANNQIVEMQSHVGVYGTTGTVCCLNGSQFRIYHLGDSRAYLFRDGQLFKLTSDQTVAQMKIDAGFYDKDDPRVQMEMHQLTKYIGCDGSGEYLKPQESEWMPLKRDDRILLCSDGLYDMCSPEQIRGILAENPASDDASEALIAAALENGGRDNVTCLVAKIHKN